MRFQQHSRKTSKGFTLAELLVAMTITVVLVSITVGLTATALDAWRGARQEIKAARQGKALIDVLSRDLESLVVRQGGESEWLRVLSEREEIGPEGQPSPNASRMIFFTSAADRYNGNVGPGRDDRGGDVCLVGYQLEYGDPIFGESENKNASTFVLYRDLTDPDVTFQRYLGSNDLEKDYRRDSGGGQISGNAADYVCENIYEMSVTFVIEYLDGQGGGQGNDIDRLKIARVPVLGTSSSSSPVRDFALKGSGIETNSNANNAFASGRILSIDVSVTVLSDSGLRILQNSPFKTKEDKARFLAEKAFRYTKSIQIPQP